MLGEGLALLLKETASPVFVVRRRRVRFRKTKLHNQENPHRKHRSLCWILLRRQSKLQLGIKMKNGSKSLWLPLTRGLGIWVLSLLERILGSQLSPVTLGNWITELRYHAKITPFSCDSDNAADTQGLTCTTDYPHYTLEVGTRGTQRFNILPEALQELSPELLPEVGPVLLVLKPLLPLAPQVLES